MIYRFDDPCCLNGWWDILPVYADGAGFDIPDAGFMEAAYLVPSFYNKPADAVRLPGEDFYRVAPELVSDPDADNLFDAYGYPAEWSAARAVWLRRRFTVSFQRGKRYFVIFESFGPNARLYVNGRFVGSHSDFTLPAEFDITDFAVFGENEICVLLSDYERDEKGLSLYPSGNWIPSAMRGLWQNVWFVAKNEIYIDDLTIVTSVRENELRLKYVIKNASLRAADITLDALISPVGEEPGSFSLPKVSVSVDALGESEAELVYRWDNPRLWDAGDPFLYFVNTRLVAGDELVDSMTERFGFREVWIEGSELILNGHPLRLFSDWGHKVTPFHHTEGWIRKWFGMIRNFNMNHSRLHTHPHPSIIMDIADEDGIYITAETALHGSGGGQACNDKRYWENARRHVEMFVKREKNHPCVLLYSCENEIRWNGDGVELPKDELPEIRRLFNRLDPTRPAYHEGDSSLWNEAQQDIISRHYGKDCAGTGWWDKSRPLHSGEMCFFHYASPSNAVALAGGRAWESYENVTRAVALDMFYITEDARANGVCCIGPWNVSCLLNLRTHGDMTFEYDDFTAPGVKPLRARAGSSEFEFWADGKGYTPQPGSELVARAFRPFAVIDTSRRRQYFTQRPIVRQVSLVNDTGRDAKGFLYYSLSLDGRPVFEGKTHFEIGVGGIYRQEISIPAVFSANRYEFCVRAVAGAAVLDSFSAEFEICAPCSAPVLKCKIGVLGESALCSLFEREGVDFVRLAGGTLPSDIDVVAVMKDYVTVGSDVNKLLLPFTQRGGRVIFFEQSVSPFPGITLAGKSVLTAFVNTGEAVLGDTITDESLSFWGDDCYTLMSGDAYVAHRMYKKDDGSQMKPLVESGEGDFGEGDFGYSPLFVSHGRAGCVLACQLRVTDKFDEIPAARSLVFSLLAYCADYSAPKFSEVASVAGCDAEAVASALADDAVSAVFVHGLTKESAALISRAGGFDLELEEEKHGIYNAVRVENRILGGVSNEDLCGADRFPYSPPSMTNIPIAGSFIRSGSEAVRPLALTCRKSCIKEQHAFGYSSELLRTHGVTRFCYQNERSDDMIIAEISGLGKPVVVTTMEVFNDGLFAEKPKFLRVSNLIAANLGRRPHKNILEGDMTDSGESKGFPELVHIADGKALEVDTVRQLTVYLTERMNSTPLLDAAEFLTVESPEGVYGIDRPVWVYFTLTSPTVRKNLSSNLGIPDPGAQTFLHLTADGRVVLYVNGREVGCDEVSGSAIFADIELEQGQNHIVIKYEPREGGSSLGLCWRNILRREENGFIFDKKFIPV